MEGRNREAFNCFFPQIFNSIKQTMLLWKQYKFSPKYHHAHTHQKSQLTVMGRHSRCLKKKKNGFPSRLLLPDCCHYMQTLWGTAVSMIQSAAHTKTRRLIRTPAVSLGADVHQPDCSACWVTNCQGGSQSNVVHALQLYVLRTTQQREQNKSIVQSMVLTR